ncbi:hypothetical protein SK128_015768, partial [Halocaridina rubra]
SPQLICTTPPLTTGLQMLPDTAPGNKSYIAMIQVQEGIQTPLLSFSHCQELAIISPDSPKLILAVTHVNRCTELLLSATTLPSAARDFFLHEFEMS